MMSPHPNQRDESRAAFALDRAISPLEPGISGRNGGTDRLAAKRRICRRSTSRSAGTSPEYLAPVPGDMLGPWALILPAWRQDRLAVKSAENIRDDWTARDFFGDIDPQILTEGEAPQIEHLVVKWAEGEPVRHVVGAVRLEPPNMRGLEADIHSTEIEVESADRALSSVRSEDVWPELRIPTSQRRCGRPFVAEFGRRKPDGFGDIRPDGTGEMGRKEQSGDSFAKVRIGVEGRQNAFREPSCRLRLTKAPRAS